MNIFIIHTHTRKRYREIPQYYFLKPLLCQDRPDVRNNILFCNELRVSGDTITADDRHMHEANVAGRDRAVVWELWIVLK